jgi:hypothetical protein
MRIFIGIDPGKKGAAVALREDGTVLSTLLLPHTGKDFDVQEFLEWIEGLWFYGYEAGEPVSAASIIVEALGSRPHARMGASSAITMGKNWGRLEGTLAGLKLRYDVVTPQKWQKEICPGGGDPKDRSIAACKRLLPALDLKPGRRKKDHDGLADAGCIAEYCRRVFR